MTEPSISLEDRATRCRAPGDERRLMIVDAPRPSDRSVEDRLSVRVDRLARAA